MGKLKWNICIFYQGNIIWYLVQETCLSTEYQELSWSSNVVQVLRIKGYGKSTSSMKRSVAVLKDQYFVHTWSIILNFEAVSFSIYKSMPSASQHLYILKASSLRSVITPCEVCLQRYQLNIMKMLCGRSSWHNS